MLAYLFDRFPERTETFVVRELEGLAGLGHRTQLWALRPPPPECASVEGAGPFLERLRVLPGPFELRSLDAELRVMLRTPLRYAGLLVDLLRGCSRSPRSMLPELLRSDAAFGLLQELGRTERQARTTHVHAQFGFVASTVAYAAWRLARVPYSVSVHAWDVFVNRSMLPEKLLAARLVVTCTEYVRRLLLGRYRALRPEKVVCVHHGLDTELWRPAPLPGPGRFAVLAVGRLEPKKGFDVLLRAFARARAALRCDGPVARPVLTIVGEGSGKAHLETLARELCLGESLRLAGNLPEARIREELAAAHCLAAPSVRTSCGDSDGLPNVVIEAMACGRPVVASRLAGIPEAVADGGSGLLSPPGDEEALAVSLTRLARDRRLAARLGEEGRRVAVERFSLEVSSRRLAETFRRIGALP